MLLSTSLVMAPVSEAVSAPLAAGSADSRAARASRVGWRIVSASTAYIMPCAMGGK